MRDGIPCIAKYFICNAFIRRRGPALVNHKINFDSIFCDLNGPADISAEICSDKSSLLKKDGIIIHTIKVHSVADFENDFQKVKSIFKQK